MWIDSHCHLAGLEYDADREEVFARAKGAGVDTCIVIGAGDGLSGNEKAVGLVEKWDGAYAAVGLHPHDAQLSLRGQSPKQSQDYIDDLRQWAHQPKVVAIGETGLDYHYDRSPREAQQHCFRQHLALAKELKLPVIIHSREAWEDTVALVREAGELPAGGVFHCFGGSYEEARQALDLGFYISISGIVTFKKAASLIEVVQKIPLEKMLIETDAPFLAPVPHRGKRNEPAFVALVGKKIAQIKQKSVDEVAQMITNNTRKLFHL